MRGPCLPELFFLTPTLPQWERESSDRLIKRCQVMLVC